MCAQCLTDGKLTPEDVLRELAISVIKAQDQVKKKLNPVEMAECMESYFAGLLEVCFVYGPAYAGIAAAERARITSSN